MNKIMALDVGTKRIGIALSDFLHMLAIGNCAVDRTPNNLAIEKIKKIAVDNKVDTIIIGLPLNMDGSQGSQAEDCVEFAENFKSDFKVIFEDERLTSEQAEENLRNKKINYRNDKKLVDIESACIILDQYFSRISR